MSWAYDELQMWEMKHLLCLSTFDRELNRNERGNKITIHHFCKSHESHEQWICDKCHENAKCSGAQSNDIYSHRMNEIDV